MKCDRCGKIANRHKLSWFNTENLCLECATIESFHPKFEEAKLEESKKVKAGYMNFEGIGLPNDYKEWVANFKPTAYQRAILNKIK